MNAHHAVTFGRPRFAAALPLLGGTVLVLLAVLLGGLIAINNLLFAGALLAAIAVPVAVFAPRTLFWMTIVGSLVFVGLIEIYLPGLAFVRLMFPAAAALFLVATLLRRFGPTVHSSGSLDPLTVSAVVFLAVCGVSQIINWRGVGNALPGLKNYFQAWGLFLGMAVMGLWAGLDRRLPKLLLAIAMVQLPFALHQFLFIAPNRYAVGEGIVAVDIVSGTLGGNVGGGGQNAFLALFLSSVTGVLLSLWRNGALRAGWLLLMLPPLLLPLLLNSSRAAAIYAVFVFMLVFRREILHRPLRVLAGVAGLAVAASALLASYFALDQAQWGNRYSSLGQMIEETLRKQTDSSEGYGALELNRTTALTFWASQQPRYSTMQTLFGNGLAQAKEGDGKTFDNTNNLANRKYPGMGIGLTSAASLLWDLGVVGFLAAFGMVIAGILQAGRLASMHRASPYHAGLFEGIQAALVLVALSFFHKNSFTFHLGYQVFLLTMLGFLAYSYRWLPVPSPIEKKVAR